MEQMQDNTDTNMLVSVLANSDKKKPPNQITHVDGMMPDRIDSCLDDDNNDMANDNPPKREEEREIEREREITEDNAQQSEGDEYDKATPERKRLLKLDIIRKLTDLASKGVKLSQDYNMNSNYRVMKYEYELHISIRDKHNTVLFLKDGCITTISAFEKLNKRFNPFGLELEGWSDNVNNKSDQLYDVIGDLYEKWKGPGRTIPPEITLLGILSFSAAKTHWVNTYVDGYNPQQSPPRNQDKTEVINSKLANQYKTAHVQARDYDTLMKFKREYEDQQRMKPPSIPASLKMMDRPKPREATDVREHIQKFNNELKKRKLNSDVSSAESIIRVNPNIDDIINSDASSHKK